MIQSYKDLTVFRHDMKNRMLSIYTMVEQGMNKECLNYMGKLINEMKRPKKYFETGNPVLDAILTEKQMESKNKNITFKTKLEIPRQLNIKDDDWISIMGNLIDNAIEATEKLKLSPKEISMIMVYRHGYGLLSIRKALKNYQGSFDICIHEGRCLAKVHLECGEKNV